MQGFCIRCPWRISRSSFTGDHAMARVYRLVILSSDLRETLEPVFAKNLHCRESSSRKQPAARVQTERFKTLTTRIHAVLFRNRSACLSYSVLRGNINLCKTRPRFRRIYRENADAFLSVCARLSHHHLNIKKL